MAKTVSFFVSDLTGDVIYENPVRIVVHDHPQLPDGNPVELVASRDELKALEGEELDVARITLVEDGREPVTLTLPLDAFNGLAVSEPMAATLAGGIPVTGSKRQTKAEAGEKINYATLEHAGKLHRGKTTDAEKRIVQTHLDEINERLKRDGQRTINLSNPDHVARYGLEKLAKEAGHFLQ